MTTWSNEDTYVIEPLAKVVRRALLMALAETNGNQQEASRLLGITARKMATRMQQHGIPTARVSNQRQRSNDEARRRRALTMS